VALGCSIQITFRGLLTPDQGARKIVFIFLFEVRRQHTMLNILGAFAKLLKAIISFVVSVRPSAWNNVVPTGRIFMKCNT
jgi:hypothetical protein